jgi:hypothetical protein
VIAALRLLSAVAINSAARDRPVDNNTLIS